MVAEAVLKGGAVQASKVNVSATAGPAAKSLRPEETCVWHTRVTKVFSAEHAGNIVALALILRCLCARFTELGPSWLSARRAPTAGRPLGGPRPRTRAAVLCKSPNRRQTRTETSVRP